MRVLGVDPGAKGGVAIVDGGQLVAGLRMPTFQYRNKAIVNARLLINWIDAYGKFEVAVIEAVHAMPGQGVTSSFQFGRMLGAVEAIAFSYGMPLHYVAPVAWKKAMGLSSAKQDSIDAAKLYFGKAADKWIKAKADDGIAEAALLAAYWSDKVPDQ